MKKILLIAAAVVAMVSCTKKKLEPVDLVPSDSPITFKSLVALPTKATSTNVVTTATLPEGKDFKVFAKIYTNAWVAGTTLWGGATTTDYFASAGADASYESTNAGWTTNPKYYWPKNADKYLAFQAYAPATISNGTAASTATGITITDFEIATSRDGQADILYANRKVNCKSNVGTAGTKYYGVELTFNHALSQVAFTAKLSATTTLQSNEWIKITSIKLVNVNTKGNFNQNWVDNTNVAGTPTWGSLGYKQESSVDVKEYDSVVIDYNKTLTSTDAAYLNELSKLTDTASGTDFYPYLVIPQAFATTTGQESKLVIEYVTKLGATGAEIYETNTADVILSGLTYTGSPAVDQDKFQIGKKYTFNIIIGLDPIYFNPSVEAWADVTVTGDALNI